jgi:hypothetical protein
MSSPGFRHYQVHPDVIQQAQRLGLFGNVQKRIARMARHSAPFTHPAGNRRFENYIFKIEKGVVISIRKLIPETGEAVSDLLTEFERRLHPRRGRREKD